MGGRKIKTSSGRMINDPRGTEAWKRLAKRVCREEPVCWLRLPGCTSLSTTGDHVIPVPDRPDLALVRSNVRGACAPCNRRRGSVPVELLRLNEEVTPDALSVFED